MVYCTRCGAQNVEGARFCNYCSAPLDSKATAPPMTAAPPSQPPYGPPWTPGPPPQWARPRRPEEECLGQNRVPGIVVFALIILLIGIFSLVQWIVERTYGSGATGIVWPIFAVAVAILIIGLWGLMRTPRPR